MVKMCDLSVDMRQMMVKELSFVMWSRFELDQESIDEFWQTIEIGLQAREIA